MLALSHGPKLRGRPIDLARRSRSQFEPAGWRRSPRSASPRAAESGPADSARSPSCACGGGCPTCAAQKQLADSQSTAPAPTSVVPSLSAAPAMEIQRMPASATDVGSVDLGGGASVDAAQSKSSPDSQGGGDAEPASWLFNKSICPLSKCTFLKADGATLYYQVEAGGIACTVFLDLGRWSGDAKGDADLLHEAETNPGSICVEFDSDWGDPDCKNPRGVHKVWKI